MSRRTLKWRKISNENKNLIDIVQLRVSQDTL